MRIVKASGEETTYDSNKIVRSLERAGASQEMIDQVLAESEKELFDGIHTKAMYKIVFRNLRKLSREMAGKYHLKRAMMELGPTGFPFEKFIATLLKAEGFTAVTNQIVQGRCIWHEVDVIAEKPDQQLFIECKHHSSPGNICDVKHALYVYARFFDIEKELHPHKIKKHHQGWLVTNTRLSGDAEKYGQCVGLGLMSWNYPIGNSLRERIDRNGLYPITCLTSLLKHEVKKLLEKNIVLCRTIMERPFELHGVVSGEARKIKILNEINLICKQAESFKNEQNTII